MYFWIASYVLHVLPTSVAFNSRFPIMLGEDSGVCRICLGGVRHLPLILRGQFLLNYNNFIYIVRTRFQNSQQYPRKISISSLNIYRISLDIILFLFIYLFIYCLLEGVRSRSSTSVNTPLKVSCVSKEKLWQAYGSHPSNFKLSSELL